MKQKGRQWLSLKQYTPIECPVTVSLEYKHTGSIILTEPILNYILNLNMIYISEHKQIYEYSAPGDPSIGTEGKTLLIPKGDGTCLTYQASKKRNAGRGGGGGHAVITIVESACSSEVSGACTKSIHYQEFQNVISSSENLEAAWQSTILAHHLMSYHSHPEKATLGCEG